MASVQKNGTRNIVLDYDEYMPRFRLRKKRALLSYLTQPIIAELNSEKIIRFSNSGIGLSWARVLNELGYSLDIIDWDDDEFLPTRKYDLVVLHGGRNFKKISENIDGSPDFIHFLTGSYWKFNNRQEDKRIAEFKKRHGVKVARDRYIYASEDAVNSAAKGIIVLGDSSMRSTYPKKYPLVLTINNASYADGHFDEVEKSYAKAKQNFIFFAGSGNIHKGLDLLIDAFKDLQEHLYIVTVPDKEVLKVFRKELKLPNIHLVGQVNMRDPKFYKVMDKCAFVILPSCSEGMAGSVVEAMNQGLIPIVSKETRLDASKYGLVLPNNHIEAIKKSVRKMSSMEAKDVEKMSKRVRQAAQKDHSPEKFRHDLKKLIVQILKA